MSLDQLLNQVKQHPGFDRVGMVLCHNGVVRGTSRDGRRTTGLEVSVDHHRLKAIVAAQKKRPGIVEILVEINENRPLAVGDDVMFIVVAGDIRENVIGALSDTLNAIKSSVTTKTEFFA
ncbi:MAG: molybdenum cofactor biosynthesis protein MoaE [Desulfobacterales bacterium]